MTAQAVPENEPRVKNMGRMQVLICPRCGKTVNKNEPHHRAGKNNTAKRYCKPCWESMFIGD